jgi:hypothetical protein
MYPWIHTVSSDFGIRFGANTIGSVKVWFIGQHRIFTHVVTVGRGETYTWVNAEPGVGWGQLENCGWQIFSRLAFTFRIQAISSVTSCTEEIANQGNLANHKNYVGVLISLWLFLFAAQPKEFFLDRLKKLAQRSHQCVELRGEYVEKIHFFIPITCCFLYKAKDLSAPLITSLLNESH